MELSFIMNSFSVFTVMLCGPIIVPLTVGPAFEVWQKLLSHTNWTHQVDLYFRGDIKRW